MNFQLPEVRSGQPVRADDYNRMIRHVKANTISGTIGILMERTSAGIVLRAPRSQSQTSQAPSEFLFINKLSLYYNAEDETHEIWIYAPSGHPSLCYPGTSGTGGGYGSYAFTRGAQVDSSLARDGDWVNTGLTVEDGPDVWAYIDVTSGADSGIVKFASAHSSAWDAATVADESVINVQVGKIRTTGSSFEPINYIVGVVGLFASVNHSKLDFDDEEAT